MAATARLRIATLRICRYALSASATASSRLAKTPIGKGAALEALAGSNAGLLLLLRSIDCTTALTMRSMSALPMFTVCSCAYFR